MNLGQAVAVCLYELIRNEAFDEHAQVMAAESPPLSGAAPVGPCAFAGQIPPESVTVQAETMAPDKAAAAVTGNDAEQITRMLLDVLEKSGYTNRITSVSTERKIRRWIRRLRLRRRDAPLLLGILRQILWKFEKAR